MVFDDNYYLNGKSQTHDFRYFINPEAAEQAMHQGRLDQNFRTRALVFLSFAVNYQLHGTKVFGYHLVNLLIHLVNGLLVYSSLTPR